MGLMTTLTVICETRETNVKVSVSILKKKGNNEGVELFKHLWV